MRYQRNPAVSATAVDDEIFLVEPADEAVFYLDRISSGLWRLLAEPQTLDELQAAYRAAFPDVAADAVAADAVAADVAGAVEALLARGLIVPVEVD